jgi:hypothetical protein
MDNRSTISCVSRYRRDDRRYLFAGIGQAAK